MCKLGASYNLFNGEELLEPSILSIRKCVDYINVVYQQYSWTGEQANPDLISKLCSLKERGLIDNYIEYSFDLNSVKEHARKYRCEKGNFGLKDLKSAGCTHFILMDADEFYDETEFLNAKEFVYNHHITHSYCSIYDYRPLPFYRMAECRDYSVGFIHKFDCFSHVVGHHKLNHAPCHIDAFRTVPYIKLFHKAFYLNMVSMHHMTGVRLDYSNKMRNTISKYSKEGQQAIKYYSAYQKEIEKMSEEELLHSGYIKVADKFDIMRFLHNE